MKLKYGFLLLVYTPIIICDQSLTLHHYLWANYQQFGNQIAAAQQRYNLLLSSKNPCMHTRKGYIYFLHKTNQLAAIIDHAQLITSTFAKDPEIQLILVHALQKKGLTAQANTQLLEAYKTCPLDAQIVLEVAQLYTTNKELHNALTAINTYLNAAPKKQNHFVFHFLKAQIYVQLNQPDHALTSITECLELHTAFDKGWLIKAMLEEQRGELEAAIQGYSTFLELTGRTNRTIAQHLIQLTLQQKSAAHKKTFLVSQLDKALSAFEKKQYTHALAQVNLYLQKFPNDTNARLLKIQILSNTKDFSLAIKLLHDWIIKEPKNQIWFEALHLIGHNGAAPGSVLETFTSILRTNPDNLWASIYAADLQMRMGAKQSAITLLETVESRIHDPALKTKVLFQLGLLHFELKNYDQMRTYLEQAEILKTEFLPAKNLLAYYYATKGKNMARAQELIRAALAQEPNNHHYLDTQAVIEYKLGKFEQARTTLEKIHAQCPHDATVTIHLAKVLHKIGQHSSAYDMLQTAASHTRSEYEKRTTAKLVAAWK